ncbi:NAD(P)H-hydrate dehydratase [Planctomicrobium sp. SH668]|uniref:NAD(P)H-hydrate dehydratase n=1 Tax=Planctomicrobium sp. SH668 TaxID=3448126 RepID=UPI003F5C00AD
MSPLQITTLPQLPCRPVDANKGTFGKVLLVAGSQGMSGAAALAGMGALRGGAGLTFLAVPAAIAPIVASFNPSYLTISLNDDESALGAVWDAAEGKSAVGIGPGAGTGTVFHRITTNLYRDLSLPIVADADALNCLAKEPEQLRTHSGSRILTPHPGEFARLTGVDVRSIQQNREQLAFEFAGRYNITLILKGAGTVVTDGQRIYVNTTGNSGMSTGGTGDVLTGLTTALLAQGMEPFSAAQLAVYLHGKAGDLAADALSKPALIASDLPDYLGKAWLTLQQTDGDNSSQG